MTFSIVYRKSDMPSQKITHEAKYSLRLSDSASQLYFMLLTSSSKLRKQVPNHHPATH
jgi:hypothetical protein